MGSHKGKLTIALDFDGVIHNYVSGWHGMGEAIDAPVPGAAEFILRALARGFDVAIYSARSRSFRGRRAMKRYLRRLVVDQVRTDQAGLPAAALVPVDVIADSWFRQIRFPWFKPAAHITIDDRAVQFEGTFPTFTTIRNFKPWNHKEWTPREDLNATRHAGCDCSHT